MSAGPSSAPRLLFVVLAHERPDDVAQLARTLVAAASDATVMIHYDARAPQADFDRLSEAVAGTADGRLRLVTQRVACRWGAFGLVEAPLAALTQARDEGLEPDYAILLSGSCLPCRPLAQLERYLDGNRGREFIEVEDAAWVGNGWRNERWRYRFWFDHKTQRPIEWGFFQLQRALGITRAFPEGLTPRFGSQWWALSWPTVEAILADIRANPRRLDFFRSVWIPDEMMFQTWVHALVPEERIAGFGLTHFQFSDRGKPVVFHDDHLDYVPTLPRFFFRKAAPEAARLRDWALARAAEPDDGAALDRIGARPADYAMKMTAQTHYPRPGHVFFRSQYTEMTTPVLEATQGPYVVLAGPPPMTGALARALAEAAGPEGPFTILGEVFRPGEVDLGPGRDELDGLARDEAALRDLHPALYLARVRARAAGVPVLRWSPLDAGPLLRAATRDRHALVLACLPWTGAPERDRGLLALACQRARPDLSVAARLMPHEPPARLWRAQLQTLADTAPPWFDTAPAEAFHPDPDRGIAPLRGVALMPFAWGESATTPEARRATFEASLAACRFRGADWFAPVAAAAGRVFADLDAQAAEILKPAPAEAAAPAAPAGRPARTPEMT